MGDALISMQNHIDNKIIISQFEDLKKSYPELQLFARDNGKIIIAGWIQFSAHFKNKKIEDRYLIEVSVSPDYPTSIPLSKEIAGRIPENYHKLKDDYLCLGVPLAVKLKFRELPTLINYFNILLVPYLYAFSHFEKFGKMPYGDEKHNSDEIYLYYSQELFNEYKDPVIIDFLGILSGMYRSNMHLPCIRGHMLCPCNSGRILRKCHGPTLRAISKLQDQSDFYRDYIDVLYSVMQKSLKITSKVKRSYWTPKIVKKILSKKQKLETRKEKEIIG